MGPRALYDREIFSSDHKMFAEETYKFFEKEALPQHEKWEKQGYVDKAFWLKAGENGILGTGIGEAYGGLGCDWLYSTVIIEAISYYNLTGIGFGLHSDIVAPYIEHWGTEEAKKKYLPKMVTGEIISAIGMSEPEAGSDLQNIKSTAVLQGDHYVLNGSKTFITNGKMCDVAIIAAKTDPKAGAKGMSLFLVDTDSPGFEKGNILEKVGMKAQDTAELFYKDVKVPVENRLGEENAGFKYLMMELPQERLLVGISAMASAESALQHTLRYVHERRAFNQRLMDFQNTRFQLAQIKADVAAGRCLLDDAIKKHVQRKLDVPTAAMIKFWTTDLQYDVADKCLQLFGGYGYMTEYPISKIWADARVQKIYAGTNEIMKEIVARSMEIKG